MKDQYKDLICQTFDFPQEGFHTRDNWLYFNEYSLKDLIPKHGTPLRLTYLPKIDSQISQAKSWFESAMQKHQYDARYYYCYCTKSSHFNFVIDRVLQNGAHIETSSAFDIEILKRLYQSKKITEDLYIVCNGFKTEDYVENIVSLINAGFSGAMPVLDNMSEIEQYRQRIKRSAAIGIRIAAEEEPSFEFYTSRLGIRYKDVLPFYREKISNQSKLRLKMLHFFINTGIKDTAYYWSELNKFLNAFVALKKECPDLDAINIGGGLPIRHSLGADYDYAYMIEQIMGQVKQACSAARIPEPDIFTEFGNFTVGESGALIFKVLTEKLQNDSERWYMIDGSLMTTLVDVFAIGQRFILLPLNKWDSPYHRVNIGGLSCDALDYYNSEVHLNQVYLPRLNGDDPLYIGFFHVGAYQDALSGFGGIKHCLIPAPRHVVLDRDSDGQESDRVFSSRQTAASMMDILGYK